MARVRRSPGARSRRGASGNPEVRFRPLLRSVARLAPLLAIASPCAAQGPYKPPRESLPRIVGPQPVPFDHKLHAERGLACGDCHVGAETRARAGLPDRDRCMLCHRAVATESAGVQALAALPPGSRIRWERAYLVPDFVFFSHAEHAAAAVTCAACHGPVATRSVLNQEVSTSMVACMNCHAQREASNECYLCHDLGQ